MDQKQPAADRIRHVLQAMERSIDIARQRRMTGSRPVPAPAATTPPPAPVPAEEPFPPTAPDQAGQPGRLRARPKRSTPLSGFDDRTPMRPGG
ncbi:MAG: hypothetical protein KF817_15965 [Phycisphaeraceae bacterium]|nr:hypothetical protein [Phycisphaeraceae bacterium]